MLKIYLFFSLFILSSCVVSSIHRPGIQIKSKGVLRNLDDSIDVISVVSFSASFERNVHWKRFNIMHEYEKDVVFKLNTFLKEYLLEKKLRFRMRNIDSSMITLPDSMLKHIDSGQSISNISRYLFSGKGEAKKILIVRFQCNNESHGGYSTLGPVGELYTRYQITSHALLIDSLNVLYLRSNLADLPFVENFFYRRAISRVLNEAF